jgi:Dolichyl-phosphate-mannose-protein mannosyltransferase
MIAKASVLRLMAGVGALLLLLFYGGTVAREIWARHQASADLKLAVVWAGVGAAICCSHLIARRNRATLAWLAGEASAGLYLALRSGHLPSLFIVVLLVAVCAAWGDALLMALRAPRAGALERFAVAAPLGIALLSLLALGLLVLGIFTAKWSWLVVVALSVLQGPRLIRAGRALLRAGLAAADLRLTRAPPEAGAMLCLCGAALLFVLPWALAPEVQYDSLTYHLAVPKIWIEHQGLVDVPEVINSYFCHSAEALLGFGMLLRDEAVAHLLTLFMGVIAAFGTFALGRALFDGRRGLWAGALFLTTPLVLWLIGSTFIDVTVTMFGLAALTAWYRWAKDGAGPGYLWAAGLLCGAAIGAKITAALSFPLVLAFACWRILSAPRSARQKAFTALAMAGAMAVFLLPWLLVVRRFTGNPIFPFLGAIFGGRQAQLTLEGAVSGYGIGTSLPALVRLPFALTFHTRPFGEPMVDGGAGISAILFVFAVPIALRRRGPALVLLASAVAAYVFFAFKVQYLRYLIPCYPLLTVFAVDGFFAGVGEGKVARAMLGALLLLQVPVMFPLYWQIPERIPLKLLLGRETEQDFRDRAVEGQGVADYLNAVTKHGDRVLSLDTDVLRYNLRVPMERPATSTSGLNGVLSAPPGPELAVELRRLGFRFIVTDAAGTETWPPMRSRSFFDAYTAARFRKNGLTVYELCPSGCAAPAPGTNLLRNPGFEALDGKGLPQDWVPYGHPAVLEGGHSGSRSVEAAPDLGFFQRIRSNPGHLYVLHHFSRARPPQPVRLQLNWIRANGELLKADIDVVTAAEEWTEHRLDARAPDESAFVDVYVSTQGAGSAQFDDYRLAEMAPDR